jgi:methyl-accepting chemotaxis protein
MTSLRIGLSHKIFAIGVVGVVGVFAAGAIYFVGAARQAHYEQIADAGATINSLAQSLDTQLLDARRAEKDFLLRQDEKSIARHAELSKAIGASLPTSSAASRKPGRQASASASWPSRADWASMERVSPHWSMPSARSA